MMSNPSPAHMHVSTAIGRRWPWNLDPAAKFAGDLENCSASDLSDHDAARAGGGVDVGRVGGDREVRRLCIEPRGRQTTKNRDDGSMTNHLEHVKTSCSYSCASVRTQ